MKDALLVVEFLTPFLGDISNIEDFQPSDCLMWIWGGKNDDQLHASIKGTGYAQTAINHFMRSTLRNGQRKDG